MNNNPNPDSATGNVPQQPTPPISPEPNQTTSLIADATTAETATASNATSQPDANVANPPVDTPPASTPTQPENTAQSAPAAANPASAMSSPASTPPVQNSPAPNTTAQNPTKTPAAPMNPATKKLIILIAAIVGGLIVVGVVLAIVFLVILRVDYSETYRTAKELRPKIVAIRNDYSCERVLTNLKSEYTSDKSYGNDIESCKASFDGVEDLVKKLGETAGVKRDGDIRERYDAFVTTFDAAVPKLEVLAEKLELYQTWHKYIVAVDNLTTQDAESAFRAAAVILTSSNNEALKSYGEGWLERAWAYAQAYQAYYNSSYSDPNRDDLRDERDRTNSELKAYVASNKPEITELAPLSFNDTAKMATNFASLYDLIANTYEQHYDKDSGDCLNFLGEIHCE